MAQSLEAQVPVAPLRRELLPASLPAARTPNGVEAIAEERAPARGVDVFRLVVALAGIAGFLALPAALIAGLLFLLWH